MKQIKYKTLWTLDIEIDGKMIQSYSSKYKKDCINESKSWFGNSTIQKRKVLTDKY